MPTCRRCGAYSFFETFIYEGHMDSYFRCVSCSHYDRPGFIPLPAKDGRPSLPADPKLQNCPDEELRSIKARILADRYDVEESAIYRECIARGIKRTYWQTGTGRKTGKVWPMPRMVARKPRPKLTEKGEIGREEDRISMG